MSQENRSRDDHILFPVNGERISFPDAAITGREALTRSNNLPPSEHQLVLVRNGHTRLIGTEQDVDLRDEEGGSFRAARGDRSWSFTVDEIGQVWPAAEMEVSEFERHWPAPLGRQWVLERENEPDTVLTTGGLLSFGPEGVEDVVSRLTRSTAEVLVTVVTTAGVFPAEGAKRYPTTTPISGALADAARKLRITAAPDWVVLVHETDMVASFTFAQAGLSGSVQLQWGPREGGGGA